MSLARVILAASFSLLSFSTWAADVPVVRFNVQAVAGAGSGSTDGGGLPPGNGGNSVPLTLALSGSMPTWATVGDNVANTLTIAGGTPPYYTALSGSAPTGMSLNDVDLEGVLTVPGLYDFSINASDSTATPNSASVGPFAVEVANPLLIEAWPQTVEATVGDLVTMTAPDVSGGTTPFAYGLATAIDGVSVDPASGVIQLPAVAAGQVGPIVLTVVDAHGRLAATNGMTVDISDPLSIVYSGASLTLTTAQAASVDAPAVAGGRGAKTFSISAGSLPPGVILTTSDGSIAGTPTTAGSYSSTIQVTDADNRTATEVLSFTVSTPLSITGLQPSYSYHASATATVTAQAANASGTVTWTKLSGTYPSGMTAVVTTNSGVSTWTLSGTPTSQSSTTIVLQATDGAGRSTTATFDLTITAPAFPTIIASSSYMSSTGSLTLPIPSGYQDGDILVLVREFPATGSYGDTPSNFTGIYAANGGTAGTSEALYAGYARVSGPQSSIVLPANGDHQAAILYLVRDAKASASPIDTAAGGSYDVATNLQMPGISVGSRGLYFAVVSRGTSGTGTAFSWTNPASELTNFSEILDKGTSSGDGGGMAIATANINAPASIGQPTVKVAVSPQNSGKMIEFVIAP